MTALTALLLLLASADAEQIEPATPRLSVALLPLSAEGTVTSKQARGVSAQLRAAVDMLVAESALHLLPTTKEDEAALRLCANDDACLQDLARQRGADLLATGSVGVSDGGLSISARVLSPVAGAQAFSALLQGSDHDVKVLDRLARELFAAHTLRGSLRVEAQAGDAVLLDGQRRGTVGQAGNDNSLTIERLREGEHLLRVTRPVSVRGVAFEPFTQTTSIRHQETTILKVTPLPALDQPGAASSSMVGPVATLGAAGLVLGTGVTCGVLSLLDSLDIEKRAEAQQLVFPRDEGLVARAGTLAVVANVLFAVGTVAASASAVWWWLDSAANSEQP